MRNEVPKFHYLAHIALLSVLANPRMHWCYMDEDFMKLMKAIAEKCTSGTPSHMVFTKIAGKCVHQEVRAKAMSLVKVRCLCPGLSV